MRTNGDGKPVVAIDIDGTLGDYHTNFLTFADMYFTSSCGSWVEMASRMDNPGLPLWEWMGIPQRDYRDAKLAYRQGGWKRWMPVYEGAARMTEVIRSELGAEVWLCTTRPFLRLDNVDPDTREWLRRNNIQYDALIFDPMHEEDGTKYDELARQVGDRVASIVDDLPEMIWNARSAFVNLSPILRDQPYNRNFTPTFARRVNTILTMTAAITHDVCTWKDKHV